MIHIDKRLVGSHPNASAENIRRMVLVTTLLVFISFFMGCGGYSAKAHRVDPDLARVTLTKVLDGWKQGLSCTNWEKDKQPITVQDLDWLNGVKLESYQMLGADEAIDANLYCPVKLILKFRDQSTHEIQVTYIVSTKPALTVFRSIGP